MIAKLFQHDVWVQVRNSEIKQAFSCLLQNKLHGAKTMIEMEKPRLECFIQLFEKEEAILQQPQEQILYFYSTTAAK